LIERELTAKPLAFFFLFSFPAASSSFPTSSHSSDNAQVTETSNHAERFTACITLGSLAAFWQLLSARVICNNTTRTTREVIVSSGHFNSERRHLPGSMASIV